MGSRPNGLAACAQESRRFFERLVKLKTHEMKQKRHAHLELARKIIDRAEQQSRSLSAAEKGEYDAHMSAAKLWAEKIAAAEETSNRDLEIPGEVRYGRPFEEGQGFADLHRRSLPDGISPHELDLGRLVRGSVTGDWDGAEAELRSVQAIGVDSVGGFIVPSPLSARVLDLARNKMVAVRAGARVIPMESNTLDIGMLSGDPTAYWRAESATITASNATFSKGTLTAKVCAVLINSTVEFLEDAIDGGSVIENAMASALAVELDRVVFHGSGSGAEPTGILNTTGIGTHSLGTDGASIDGYDEILQALGDVIEHNYEPSSIVYAPRTQIRLARLTDSDNNPLGVPSMVQKARHFVTNQISTSMTQGNASNASAVVVGDFGQLIIGMRDRLVFEVFRSGDSNASKMEVTLRAFLRADVLVTRPSAFSSVVGIIPA